jgi:hypothetical protein
MFSIQLQVLHLIVCVLCGEVMFTTLVQLFCGLSFAKNKNGWPLAKLVVLPRKCQ